MHLLSLYSCSHEFDMFYALDTLLYAFIQTSRIDILDWNFNLQAFKKDSSHVKVSKSQNSYIYLTNM